MEGFSNFLESQVKRRIEDEDEVKQNSRTLDYFVPHRIKNSID